MTGTLPETKIDIVVADGNSLMLSALADKFQRDARFSLIASVASAENFLSMVIRMPVAIGVIDWTLPLLGGARLLEVLREQPNAPRMIVYADDPRGELARKALAAGAAGFCPRSAPVEDLLDLACDVAAGKMVFPYLDIRELETDPISTLSRKERAILDALAEGLTNKQLAARLEISTNTVKFHLSNIFDKLSVKNRAQAIAHFYASKAKSGG